MIIKMKLKAKILLISFLLIGGCLFAKKQIPIATAILEEEIKIQNARMDWYKIKLDNQYYSY